MTLGVELEHVVDHVRRDAEKCAIADLHRQRDLAQQLLAEKARRLIPSTRRAAGSRPDLAGVRRYDPTVRVVWDWYLKVGLAVLDQRFGFASVDPPDAAAVEDAARRIGSARSYPQGEGPLLAAAVAWRHAQESAEVLVLQSYRSMKRSVIGRAETRSSHMINQLQTDLLQSNQLQNQLQTNQLQANRNADPEADPDGSAKVNMRAGRSSATASLWAMLTTDDSRAILRHWYRRCYEAVLDAQLGLLQPLCAVTGAEAAQVAASLEHREFRQLIGADGVPLMTTHGTAVTALDRRLAEGHTGVVPAVEEPTRGSTNRTLRSRVVGDWTQATPQQRAQWLDAAGSPQSLLRVRWTRIPGVDQSRLIGHWLDAHRGDPDGERTASADTFRQKDTSEGVDTFRPVQPTYPTFRPVLLTGTSEDAAAAMFNHAPPLPHPLGPSPSTRTPSTRTSSTPKSATVRGMAPAAARRRAIGPADKSATSARGESVQVEPGVVTPDRRTTPDRLSTRGFDGDDGPFHRQHGRRRTSSDPGLER